MDFEIYQAPEGYVYEKDGVKTKKVITLKDSNTIKTYNLIKED